GDITDVADPDAGFLVELARDGRLERLADLDEAGERRIAPRWIVWLATEEQAVAILGQHDDDGIDARVMFGSAARAAPRPAAPDRFGQVPAIRAEAVAAVPAGKAERGGEQRRIVAMQQRHGAERRWRIGDDRLDRRIARRTVVQAEEQLGRRWAPPHQSSVLRQDWQAVLPLQLACIVPLRQIVQRRVVGAQRVCAVEAG